MCRLKIFFFLYDSVRTIRRMQFGGPRALRPKVGLVLHNPARLQAGESVRSTFKAYAAEA